MIFESPEWDSDVPNICFDFRKQKQIQSNDTKRNVGEYFNNVPTAAAAAADDDDDDVNVVANDCKVVTGDSFRGKLIKNLKGSRFRYLNEMLYTSTGNEAINIFKEDANAFAAYHEGYRQQVKQWPLNPLNRIIKSIRKLPHNYVIADFGCGDAVLARSVRQKVYSLDLIAATKDVIPCDMANTPLETSSINIVVFCLSLMGTNLKDFILEANRVLKIGGQIKIAEIESRFNVDIRQFVHNIEQCGFHLISQDLTNKLIVFFNFKKIKTIHKHKNNIKMFSLKPCLYKKR